MAVIRTLGYFIAGLPIQGTVHQLYQGCFASSLDVYTLVLGSTKTLYVEKGI